MRTPCEKMGALGAGRRLLNQRSQLVTRSQVQLGAGAVDVTFHGARREVKPLCDGTVGQPGRNKIRDLTFPWRQWQVLGGVTQRRCDSTPTDRREPMGHRRQYRAASTVSVLKVARGGLRRGVSSR